MRKRDTFNGVIETILPALTLAAQLAPVLYLDAACSLVVAIFNATQEVSHSRAALDELTISIGEFVFRACESANNSAPKAAERDIQKLEGLLEEIKAYIEGERQLSTLKFIISRNDRIQKISSFNWRLQHLGTAFTCNALQDAKEWRLRFEKATAVDHETILHELQSLQQNQNALMAFIERQNTTIEAVQLCLARFIKTQDFAHQPKEKGLLRSTLTELERFSGSAAKVESWTITSLEIDIRERIGSGGFGDVRRAIWQHTDVAVKLFNASPYMAASSKVSIRHEIKIWSELRHPNVIQFLAANTADNAPFLVMPLFRSNVCHFLRENPQTERSRIIIDIATGLNYLHNFAHPKGKGIVHGDLKAMNCLVDLAGSTVRTVLCDFGLSELKADVATQSKLQEEVEQISGGSRCWMSPERLRGSSLRISADVYAFGLVIYEIYSGQVPFGQLDRDIFIECVCVRGYRPERPTDSQITDETWIIAQDCWQSEVKDRPTMSAVLDLLFSANSQHQSSSSEQSRAENAQSLTKSAHEGIQEDAAVSGASEPGATLQPFDAVDSSPFQSPIIASEGSPNALDISATEKAESDRHFKSLDIYRRGYIYIDQATPFFNQSGLLPRELATIWNSADYDNEGQLDAQKFAFMMRLVKDAKEGKRMPDALRSSMISSPRNNDQALQGLNESSLGQPAASRRVKYRLKVDCINYLPNVGFLSLGSARPWSGILYGVPSRLRAVRWKNPVDPIPDGESEAEIDEGESVTIQVRHRTWLNDALDGGDSDFFSAKLLGECTFVCPLTTTNISGPFRLDLRTKSGKYGGYVVLVLTEIWDAAAN